MNNRYVCDLCSGNYIYINGDSETICLLDDRCPVGYYRHPTPATKECLPCSTHCLTCENSDKCTTCETSSPYYTKNFIDFTDRKLGCGVCSVNNVYAQILDGWVATDGGEPPISCINSNSCPNNTLPIYINSQNKTICMLDGKCPMGTSVQSGNLCEVTPIYISGWNISLQSGDVFPKYFSPTSEYTIKIMGDSFTYSFIPSIEGISSGPRYIIMGKNSLTPMQIYILQLISSNSDIHNITLRVGDNVLSGSMNIEPRINVTGLETEIKIKVGDNWSSSHDSNGILEYRFGYNIGAELGINYLTEWGSETEWIGLLPGDYSQNTTIILLARNLIGSVNMTTEDINITAPIFFSESEKKDFINNFIKNISDQGIDKLRTLYKIANWLDTQDTENKLIEEQENGCGGCGKKGNCSEVAGKCICEEGWGSHPKCIISDETALAQINNTLGIINGKIYIYLLS